MNKPPKTYISMPESTFYKDLKKSYEKVDWKFFEVKVGYDKWWHRFIPSKRKDLKAKKELIEYFVNQKEFVEKTLDKFRDGYLYGKFEGDGE